MNISTHIRILLILLITVIGGVAQSQTPVWDNLDLGFNSSGNCLLQVNDKLFAGGNFTQAGTVSASRVAVWDGIAWSAVGLGFNASVKCLATFNNQIYAGGTFTSSGSTTCAHIAKWNGFSWESVGGGILGTAVYGMLEYDGKLYVTGKFHQAGNTAAYNVAAWDGTTWNSVGVSGFNMHPFYYGMCMEEWNGKLFIGGLIDSADFQEIGYIVEWDGVNWNNMQHGLNGPVNALESYNGILYAGGWFTSSWNAQQMIRLASWDGSSWTAVGSGVNDGVLSLFGYGDYLYIGGWFTGSVSVPSSHLITWDGVTYGSVGQLSDAVNALCGDEGILYATGLFQIAGSVNVNCIAKYSAPGVGISDLTTGIIVKVHPNPSSGVFYFQVLDCGSGGTLEVYSVVGLCSRRIDFDSEDVVVDLRNEPPGLYFFTVTAPAFRATGTITLY